MNSDSWFQVLVFLERQLSLVKIIQEKEQPVKNIAEFLDLIKLPGLCSPRVMKFNDRAPIITPHSNLEFYGKFFPDTSC